MSKHQIYVGQRVMDSDGIEGVVLSIEVSPFSKAVARVQYRSGGPKPERFVYVDSLVPAKPVAKPGDRVRDIHGKEGVVLQTGMTGLTDAAPSISVASVRYDDGSERPSVFTDSLTVLPAKTEDNSTTVEQALKLLGTEYSDTTTKIEELQAYKKSLGVAIDTLVGTVA